MKLLRNIFRPKKEKKRESSNAVGFDEIDSLLDRIKDVLTDGKRWNRQKAIIKIFKK